MAKRVCTVLAYGSDAWMNSHGILTAAADNVLCSRIADAARAAHRGGDSIDYGLSLLAELQRQGFGVVYVGEPGSAVFGVSVPPPSAYDEAQQGEQQ